MDSPPIQAVTRPEVSVIILTYNSRVWLEALMASVWQTKGNYEVIVADNHSSDGSLEFVQANHPRARTILNSGNLGYTGGNNEGAKHAAADILVFLNPDTTVEPDWLVELLKPFKDPTVGLTTSRIVLMPRPQILNACGLDVHISGLALCRGMGRPREAYAAEEEVTSVMGAAFAIRREIFAQVGGFNDCFFTYNEEYALSVEAWLRGWRCVYTPQSIVHHDYKLRFGPNKTFHQERNRYLLLLQCYKLPTLLVLLPTLLLTEFVTWGFVIARDRSHWRNKLKAYVAIFTNWSTMTAKRRLNQAQRKISDRTFLRRTGWAVDFGQVERTKVTQLAALVFNPLYWLLRQVTLFLVRW